MMRPAGDRWAGSILLFALPDRFDRISLPVSDTSGPQRLWRAQNTCRWHLFAVGGGAARITEISNRLQSPVQGLKR